MHAFRVALFGDGHACRDAEAVLARGGFRVMTAHHLEHFREHVPLANCAVLFAIEVTDDHLPNPFIVGHLPRVVVVSPLPLAKATRQLADSTAVHEVLAPEDMHRLILRTVADAALGDVLARIRCEVMTKAMPRSARKVREALQRALAEPVTSVQSMARASGSRRNTMEKEWRKVFPEAPSLDSLIRGLLLLRCIRSRLRDADRDWNRIASEARITTARLRAISRAFAGATPRELDLGVSPGALLAHICARTFPIDVLSAD